MNAETGTAPVAVYLQDGSSLRYHKAYRDNNGTYKQEGCNLDDAGQADEVSYDAIVNADVESLCHNDFADLILERTIGPEPE